MPLNKEQKRTVVAELEQKIKDSKASAFADFQGVSVKDMQAMKRELRASGVEFMVVKKTLIKIAATNAGYTEIPKESLEGSVGIALSMEDEMAAVKLLSKFAKANEKFKLRGGLFEGKVLSVAEAKALADLPSKEELLSKLVYVLKSPIQGFHGVLNNTISGFVRVLNAVKEKQEQGA